MRRYKKWVVATLFRSEMHHRNDILIVGRKVYVCNRRICGNSYTQRL
mgnify:CR=1 FL=1